MCTVLQCTHSLKECLAAALIKPLALLILQHEVDSFGPHKDQAVAYHLTPIPLCQVFHLLISCNPARALRALGLLLTDSAPTVGGGKTF